MIGSVAVVSSNRNLPLGAALRDVLGKTVGGFLPPLLKQWLAFSESDPENSPTFIDELLASNFSAFVAENTFYIECDISYDSDQQLSVPIGPLPLSLSLLGHSGDPLRFTINLQIDVSESEHVKVALSVSGVSLLVSLKSEILHRVDDQGLPLDEPVEFLIDDAIITCNESFDTEIRMRNGLSLSRCMIGESGVVIAASNITPSISQGRIRFGELIVSLPNDIPAPDLYVQDAVLDKDGFSGELSTTWKLHFDPSQSGSEHSGLVGEAVGELFSSLHFGIRLAYVKFDRNIPVESRIEVLLIVPALDNHPLEATLKIGATGEVEVEVHASYGGELLTLSKADLFDLEVSAIDFRRTAEETAFTLSGGFELTAVEGFIPKLGLEGLTIFRSTGGDGDWGIRLDGGTVQVNKTVELFGVARADIKEIGLGKRDDDGNVFTFSGGLQLLDGINANAQVEGLRVSWQKKKLGLDGASVAVVVPNSFEFAGAVLRKEEEGKSYFEGALGLTLIPLGLGVNAALKIGKSACRFAFLSADARFPAPGIQLGPLPLYLRGIGGLVGINMSPDADAIEDYFPLAARAPTGLTSPAKWRDDCGTHALGLTATVATANPRLLSLDAMVAFVYPDLVLLIEGGAFVLEEPQPGKTPPFHTLMALELDDQEALINLAVQFDFIKGVISADGMCEAYFSPDGFYVELGQAQRYGSRTDQPISANVLQLFKAQGFVIVRSIPSLMWALGASIGLPKKEIDLAVASVRFNAAMAGEGAMYWGPEQFSGGLNLNGNVALRVFKIGFDIGLEAGVTGKTPDWLVDALLRFFIRFKVLWKKVEIEGTLPFHWERRVRPPIPPVLKEIRVEDPATGQTLVPPAGSRLAVQEIPMVEPGALIALEFAFPVNDRTGHRFGQDVSVVVPHRSGDYEFEAELPGGAYGARGIELYRASWDDYKKERQHGGPPASWQRFSDGTGGDAALTLFGAWQADAAPDGTQGRTHLHLFARTPFQFNRGNRLRKTQADLAYDVQHHDAAVLGRGTSVAASRVMDKGSNESKAWLVNAARSMLSDQPACGLNIPRYERRLKSPDNLRSVGTRLPLGSLHFSYRVPENANYPATRRVPENEICLNFQTTSPGWRGPDQLILVGYEQMAESAGANWVDAVAGAIGAGRDGALLGIGEIVEDPATPYPFRYLHLHTGEGMRNDRKAMEASLTYCELKFRFRRPARQFTLHFEGVLEIRLTPGTVRQPAIKFFKAFQRAFSTDNFWASGAEVPADTATNLDDGTIMVARTANGGPFNEVRFLLNLPSSPASQLVGPVRVFSFCISPDYEADLGNKADQLEGYIDATWPNDSEDGGFEPDDSGPTAESGMFGPDGIAIPWGGVQPGYVYKLSVSTNHRMSGNGNVDTRFDPYSVMFRVAEPPKDFRPYVAVTFPRSDGFPHYRAQEFFVRFTRSDFLRLVGDQSAKLSWRLLLEGEHLATMPYHDKLDVPAGGLPAFARVTDENRTGWGWGKADGHLLTREEAIWLDVYNRTLPSGQEPVTSADAVPDDMVWVYPVNPIFFREGFDVCQASGSIPGFDGPWRGDGSVPPQNPWSVRTSLLVHASAAEAPNGDASGAQAETYLFPRVAPLKGSYQLSTWIRPKPGTPGLLGIVAFASLSPGNKVADSLLVQIDVKAGTASLLRSEAATASGLGARLSPPRPVRLAEGMWGRLLVRVAPIGGKTAVTVECANEVVLSESVELEVAANARPGLYASDAFVGEFDNFEVLLLDRMKQLPRPGRRHLLRCFYSSKSERYALEFVASKYLDLFDHLNSWDRRVRQASTQPLVAALPARPAGANGSGSTPAIADPILEAVEVWVAWNGRLLEKLGEADLVERELLLGSSSREDLNAAAEAVRVARFGLDEAFACVVARAGLEPALQPNDLSVQRASSGKTLLIQSGEPIDWTRILAGKIAVATGGLDPAGCPVLELTATQMLYSSDLTKCLLLVGPTGSTPATFEALKTYVWRIDQFTQLPPHLSWLRGWIDHRRDSYSLTLEMPQGSSG